MAGRLQGKIAIVTGGARGQGASHGELMAREGAKVVLADVLDQDGSAMAERLAGEGLQVAYTHLDVSSPADWKDAVAFTNETFGPVTVLVNNAGIGSTGHPTGLMECSLE